jgi:glucuronoarabinoxylan endo-1,4-beta-xylanase
LRPRLRLAAECVLRRRAGTPIVLLLAAACTPNGAGVLLGAAQSGTTTAATQVVVDSAARRQSITGFGASSAWTGGSITPELADLLFSPETGFGLSLLRMHIAPDGTTTETDTARLAVERGVKVWAAPWSPPGDWKTSGTDTNGGSLLPDYYQPWADRLAGFVEDEAAAGVPLMGLSAQNEPNWTATWETCEYAPADLNTFIRDYLSPTLKAASPKTKLLAPETIDWSTLKGFADPLLADPDTTAALDVIAVHDYGGVPFDYTAAADAGKEVWETEVSYDGATGIVAALETARQIQQHFVNGQVNAFHYWWLLGDRDTGGGLLVDGEPTPQAYGFAHYSKFIRPGYVRLDVPSAVPAGVVVSAFFDPASARTVVVLVNGNASAVDLSLRFAGISPKSVATWLTTSDLSLSDQGSTPFVTPFPYSLPGDSVTTLVTVDDTAPPSDNGGAGGEAGQAGATNAAGGAPNAGSGGEGESNPDATGGTGNVSEGSGGTAARPPGNHHPSGGGSTSTGGTAAEGGAGDVPDAGVTSDGGTEHHLQPGYYSPCQCTLPASSGGGSLNAAPLLGLLAFFGRRRRVRRAC